MSAEQVGAENPSAAFLDQHLVAGVFLANPSGGIPAGGNSPLGLEAQALFPSGLFLQADRSQWRGRQKNPLRRAGGGDVPVSLQRARRPGPPAARPPRGRPTAAPATGGAARPERFVGEP